MITIEKKPYSKTVWYSGEYTPDGDPITKPLGFSIGITDDEQGNSTNEINWEEYSAPKPKNRVVIEQLILEELDNLNIE